MNDNSYHNPNNLGDQIKDIISDAVGGENYDQLNKKIADTVNSALNEARAGITKGLSEAGRATGQAMGGAAGQAARAAGQAMGSAADSVARAAKAAGQAADSAARKNGNVVQPGSGAAIVPATAPVNKKQLRRVRFGLMLGFGIAGIVIFSGLTLAFLICSLVGLPGMFPGAVVFGLLDMACITVTACGGHGMKFGSRLKQYLRIMKDRCYFEIEELARRTNLPQKRIVKDLEKMIRWGVFPEGHLDEKKTQFIGDHKTYQQYLLAQESLKEREDREAREAYEREHESDQMREVREAIETGQQFLTEIRTANDMIPGEEVSKKLDITEMIVGKIFDRIREKPELLPEIRRFMIYYLPTTQKLIHAYKEFDGQPIQTESVLKSKAEIEKTLDTINEAFYNLYNSLYQDEAMDVASDISVLHAMFAQEGLTRDDFTK